MIENQGNCPFCSSQIKKYVFDESEQFLALYNRAPILPGHSMVVPKRHIESMLEYEAEGLREFFLFAQKVTKTLLKAFESDAFDWSYQEKEAAGQSVPHLHMHIIPRKIGDLENPGKWYEKLQQQQFPALDNQDRLILDDESLQQIIQKLKNSAEM